MSSTNLDKYKNVTKSQAEVFVILENMRMKVIVTWCVIVAFFVILIFLFLLFTLIKSTWQDKAVVAALDAILGGTMYPLVAHYLPSKNKATELEKNNFR